MPLKQYKIDAIRSQERRDWSKQVLKQAGVEHLDKDAIALAREKYKEKMNQQHISEEVDAMSDEQFLTKLKLMINGKITHAGMLLLANCWINANYHGLRGVVIRKAPDKLTLANPGYIRTGKKKMHLGGDSNPRNKALMKIFNFINIVERAGSGVPNIFNVWADEGWEEPVIEERFDPDRTVLTLSFVKKVAEKSDRKDTATL